MNGIVRNILLATALFGFTDHAYAENSQTTILHLSATGTATAPPTLLTARFEAQVTAKTAVKAQQQVNARVAQAMKAAQDHAKVRTIARDYSVNEEQDSDHHSRWVARQEIEAESEDSAAVLKLSGVFQSLGLMLQGLEWSLDAKTRDRLAREARHDAIDHLKAEAQDTAQTLSMQMGGFTSLTVMSGNAPRPVMMAARFAKAPQRSEEPQEVAVTVSAEITLKP